jgi:hypothetical protein
VSARHHLRSKRTSEWLFGVLLLVPAVSIQYPGPTNPGPPGLNVTSSELAAEERDLATPEQTITSAAFGDWDPLLVPADVVAPPGIPCYASTSSTAPWVHIFYLYQKGTTNRLEERADTIRELVAMADLIYSLSAERTGGVRHVRWKVTPACKLSITPVAVNLHSSIGTVRAYLRAKGLLKTTEKGLAFREGSGLPILGLGEWASDSRPGQNNRNNLGGTFGWVYLDGLEPPGGDVTGRERMFVALGEAAAHELGHTIGAVQLDAPHAAGSHCWDGVDLMCHVGGGGVVVKPICPATIPELFDCRNDDYFNTHPKAGSYLATHWNIARSKFLATRTTSRWDRLARPAISWGGSITGSTLASGTLVDADVIPAGDGRPVAAVGLMVNDEIVDVDREAPFSPAFYPPSDTPPGSTARIALIAYDELGRRAMTAPISVTVGEGGEPRPIPTPPPVGFDVNVAAPSGDSVSGPFVVQVTIADASISRVEISVNDRVIGDAQPPSWSVTVDPAALGAASGDTLWISATVTQGGTTNTITISVLYLPS